MQKVRFGQKWICHHFWSKNPIFRVRSNSDKSALLGGSWNHDFFLLPQKGVPSVSNYFEKKRKNFAMTLFSTKIDVFSSPRGHSKIPIFDQKNGKFENREISRNRQHDVVMFFPHRVENVVNLRNDIRWTRLFRYNESTWVISRAWRAPRIRFVSISRARRRSGYEIGIRIADAL